MSQKHKLTENSQAPYTKMKHSNTPLPPCACNDLKLNVALNVQKRRNRYK